jgi:putative thioredoxin
MTAGRGDPVAPDWIRDVGEEDFEREVLKRSEETPVVVDFWAPWCAPCRTLGPLLERLADEHGGDFVLARVDVDAAPLLAQRLGVRSIPSVFGFRDGEIAATFVGAQPEPALRAFLAKLLPTEAERSARKAAELAAAGDFAAAESALRAALEDEPRNGRALLALARLLAQRDEIDQALALVERVVPVGRFAAEKDHLAAELRMRRDGGADLAALRANVEADPDALAPRLELGRALGAQGRHEEALAVLLELVKRDPHFENDAARRAMLDLFELLGPDHPLTQRFRGELARSLYR